VPRRYARFVRSDPSELELAEVARVDVLAQRLLKHIEDTTGQIDLVHVHGASSSAVQDVIGQLLQEVGFGSEVVLTPQNGFVTRARPDFVYRMPGERGIIAEVERGGTTTNNHDLKDFWKTHIARDAHHIFLVVPMANWNASGAARERPFARVAHRIAAFFGDPRREVDVLSAHVFGYGSDGRKVSPSVPLNHEG